MTRRRSEIIISVMRRRTLLYATACAAVVLFFLNGILWFALMDGDDPPPIKDPRIAMVPPSDVCTAVDVVYTWVNGSDPAHQASLKLFNRKWDAGFREYGVLKYSMRSVEKFMPWARDIVLVTNGQVPSWVNLSAPHFRLITHDEIFPRKSDLPTFNSNAIEAHLHKIPGLAPCIVYLNDDMFLANYISKDLFIDSHSGAQKLVLSEGYIAPMEEKMRSNLWHRSVGTSNELISKFYYPNATKVVPHRYVGHVCYFMRKDILDVMYTRWKTEFDRTSTHRFRNGDDTAVPFIQSAVALEEYGGVRTTDVHGMYGTWTPTKANNDAFWKRLWSNSPHCACMNDGLDSTKESQDEIARLQDLFSAVLPKPSRIERKI
ncbi:sugar phosphotransferase [Pelomyxa schiedti]|nr:sugar phosphotransferase [Pelomyxa schiedti]